MLTLYAILAISILLFQTYDSKGLLAKMKKKPPRPLDTLDDYPNALAGNDYFNDVPCMAGYPCNGGKCPDCDCKQSHSSKSSCQAGKFCSKGYCPKCDCGKSEGKVFIEKNQIRLKH